MQVFEMKMRNILIGCMLGDPEGRAPESSWGFNIFTLKMKQFLTLKWGHNITNFTPQFTQIFVEKSRF
jgi:hypothetical protein